MLACLRRHGHRKQKSTMLVKKLAVNRHIFPLSFSIIENR
ncbi:hypothetical protein BRO54_2198 [Geobacillus proteiniphilus]|uniref:Uncharacterized protein n=1 Tax=Geobacillus proteiniphilus TaxID=860353 RepID=A0A1Q5SYE0_9BACL|nr:hypothetical protein BRO54_2198 [Geobacillus proteiniphilus]